MSLTRDQFRQACQLYIQFSPYRWTWKTHHAFPNLGYLVRYVTLPETLMRLDIARDSGFRNHDTEDEDVATAQVTTSAVSFVQYVVYSPTFQVPAFYFTLNDSRACSTLLIDELSGNQITEGASLRLDDILQTSLFRFDLSPHHKKTTFALTESNSDFPLLSYGDHPILGTPCWYFHPCETSKAVGELVKELSQNGWSEDERLLQWLKAWFLILGNAVNLDP